VHEPYFYFLCNSLKILLFYYLFMSVLVCKTRQGTYARTRVKIHPVRPFIYAAGTLKDAQPVEPEARLPHGWTPWNPIPKTPQQGDRPSIPLYPPGDSTPLPQPEQPEKKRPKQRIITPDGRDIRE
jgi:hypothetical protein